MLLLFFILFTLTDARFIWHEPKLKAPEEFKVLNVPEQIFRTKTLDTYTVLEAAANEVVTELFNHSTSTLDPYKGSGATSFAMLGSDSPIPVYDLDGKHIKNINDVYVECYDIDDCSYQLTKTDIAYLSLYASFIDNSGFQPITEPYSLGLIRGKNTQSLMGMYTEGFTVTQNHKAFWIRLWKGGKTSDGAEHLYNELGTDVAKTVALLELAVHERSHYDVPVFDSDGGHCSSFQVNYNSLIQRSYKRLHAYEHLLTHELRGSYSYYFPWFIFVTTITLLAIVVFIIAFS